MATISEVVSVKGPEKIGVFFTAPFDCIIGIHLLYQLEGYISRDKTYSTDGMSNLYINITPTSSVVKDTKISSIIMKAGERLRCDAYYIHAYITGVSA